MKKEFKMRKDFKELVAMRTAVLDKIFKAAEKHDVPHSMPLEACSLTVAEALWLKNYIEAHEPKEEDVYGKMNNMMSIGRKR